MRGGPMTAGLRLSKLGFDAAARYRRRRALDGGRAAPLRCTRLTWEQDGKIIADGRRRGHRTVPLTSTANRPVRRYTAESASVDHRPAEPTRTPDEQIINDRDIQFPRPDDRLDGPFSLHAFANSNLHSRDGWSTGMDPAGLGG